LRDDVRRGYPDGGFRRPPPPPSWNPEFEVGGTNNADVNGWYKVSVNKNAIDDLNDAIDDMYNALAINQTVFTTAQGMHSLADNLAKGLLADIDDFTFYADDDVTEIPLSHDDLVDNSRAFLKAVIGAEIKNYMDKHFDAYMDPTVLVPVDSGKTATLNNNDYTLYTLGGDIFFQKQNGDWFRYKGGSDLDGITKIKSKEWTNLGKKQPTLNGYSYDYEDYLNTYIAAVNNALTSSKAQKGIEAFAYTLAAVAVQDSVNDKLDDLRDEVVAWNDYGTSKWDEFGFTPASADLDDLFNNVTSNVFVPGAGLTDDEYATARDIATGDAAKLIVNYMPQPPVLP